MTRNTARFALLTGTAAVVLAACSSPEPVVVQQPAQPIFTKRGDVISTPTVVAGGGGDFDADFDGDDDDDDDGDDEED
ncbi:hypothetical protein [Jannaschia marina]|uniref:hypothetical protein n=1 Tax=Jannaschia marina TaxID=2741674 RepID=UPI0015C6C6FD|nr:hypothetical protein [Jannaschia marina]